MRSLSSQKLFGILHIDPHTKQLIRKKGQNIDGFPNPILQAIVIKCN